MAHDLFDAIEFVKREGDALLARFVRAHRDVAHADLRFEVVYIQSSAADNGEARDSAESETAFLGVSVWARAAPATGCVAAGQGGYEVGRLARDRRKLAAAIGAALSGAYARARVSVRAKAGLARREPGRTRLDCAFARAPRRRRDLPRRPARAQSGRIATAAWQLPRRSAAWAAKSPSMPWRRQAELRHELFVNSAGALIAQGFAFAQGDCYVVAQTADGHQETWDVIGQQRGFECLSEVWRDELAPNPDLHTFAVELARRRVNWRPPQR